MVVLCQKQHLSSVYSLLCVELAGSGVAVRLPWGAVRERVAFPESVHINVNNKPGAFVLQMLFAEFTVLAEKKIELVLDSQVIIILIIIITIHKLLRHAVSACS